MVNIWRFSHWGNNKAEIRVCNAYGWNAAPAPVDGARIVVLRFGITKHVPIENLAWRDRVRLGNRVGYDVGLCATIRWQSKCAWILAFFSERFHLTDVFSYTTYKVANYRTAAKWPTWRMFDREWSRRQFSTKRCAQCLWKIGLRNAHFSVTYICILPYIRTNVWLLALTIVYEWHNWGQLAIINDR